MFDQSQIRFLVKFGPKSGCSSLTGEQTIGENNCCLHKETLRDDVKRLLMVLKSSNMLHTLHTHKLIIINGSLTGALHFFVLVAEV